MLIEILQMFKNEKNYSLEELSVILKIDIATVKAQLEYLEYHGYIERVKLQTNSCNKTCIGCKGCREKVKIPTMWQLVN